MKFIDLTETIIKDLHLTDSEASGVGAAMSWLHMHQDQVPRRTITESEFERAWADSVDQDARKQYRDFLVRLGLTIVPDPEPMPTIEFARDIMRFESGDPDIKSVPHWAVNMASYLMDAGYVKAPGGDDE